MSGIYEEYFYNLIENDPKLAKFKNDLGLALISKSLDYKITQTKDIITNEIKENYYPTRLETLIAYSMYRIGYFRFKRPLSLEITCLNQNDKDMPIYSRFSDGQNVYITTQDYHLQANVPQIVEVTQAERYTKNITINEGQIYSYIDLNINYDDLTKIRVFKGDTELTYSQNFVAFESDYSFEMNIDGYLSIVVLLGNENGSNIQIGDELSVEYWVSSNIAEKPDNIGIIENGYDLVVTDINIKENFEPFFSEEYMKQMAKYGRKNIGDITLNEDYRQFILKNVANLQVLKVWQEREETKQNGYSLENINKVFCCYIDSDDNPSQAETPPYSEIAGNIVNAVQKYNYGKEVRIKEAQIYDLYVSIIVTTNERYNGDYLNYLKSLITGYYDDIHTPINKDIIYGIIFNELKKKLSVFSLVVALSQKGDYMNEKIYRIKDENIEISVIQNGSE